MNNRHSLMLFCLLIGLLLFQATATAAWQENRLTPLEKITVGPWDNFEVTVSKDDKQVFYTRDQNQIPNVYQLKITENESQQFIGSEGDAKDPILSPDAKHLAFTYYKDDAQGDICVFTLETKVIQCADGNKSIDESPFWLDANRLGYLRRNVDTIQQELVIYTLGSKFEQVLHRGAISSPVASPDGKYIVFDEVNNRGEFQILVYEVATQQTLQPKRFDLPGISGFMAFSQAGDYLYFNHYLADTNFDQIINANDHSVAFRIPFKTWLNSKTSLLPEQLTSVENNCKFPALSEQHLYLTCAFEGSLDIYRLPLTGSVAQSWNEKQLWEAHKAARSYEDRLLILNTIRYRFKNNGNSMLERLLTNHLEIGEYTAAGYYIKQLIASYELPQQLELAEFYQALERILHIRSQKQQLPDNVIPARFQRLVENERQRLTQQITNPNLLAMVNAHLDYELSQNDRALQQLEKIRLKLSTVPMLHYLSFSLYENILAQQNTLGLLNLYPVMFNDNVISQDARLYYAYNYLKLLNQRKTVEKDRITSLQQQLKTSLDPKVASLFQAELISLQLALADQAKEQGSYFKKLSALLKENKDDLILRKIQHIRAIQILGAADQLQYMELLSRNWLITTHISQMEFYNVAEQYSVITMDKAYGRIAEGEPAKAFATFYSAIRQTNDLEAHYQFLSLGLDPGVDRLKNMEEAYVTLEKQKILGEQRNYVNALRKVMDYEKQTKKEEKFLQEAIDLLQQMPNVGPATAMRELLLGYIYHLQLRKTQSGFDFDKSLYQKTHYHYMMALDFGRKNTRIEATVWQNLGWLHFEVRNYGLSADFFKNRIVLPFVSVDDEIQTRWAYAKSLFYNYQNDKAYAQAIINQQLAMKNKSPNILPYIEKSGFYAVQAKQYDKAVLHYQELLKHKNQLSPENRSKALLAYSYALMKLGKTQRAIAGFDEVLSSTKALKPMGANETRLVSFEPMRLDLLSLGFLAKIHEEPSKKVTYLSQRITLLNSIKKNVDRFTLDEAKRLSLIIKDYQHMALAHEIENDSAKLQATLNNSFDHVLALAKLTADDIGPVVYRGMLNYLSLAISNATEVNLTHQELKTLFDRMMQAFNKIPYRTDYDVYQQLKLQLLWYAFKKDRPAIDSLLTGEALKNLRLTSADVHSELIQLANYFKRTIYTRSVMNLGILSTPLFVPSSVAPPYIEWLCCVVAPSWVQILTHYKHLNS